MLDFRIGRTLALLARTAPFLLLRLAIYFGIALAYVLAVAIGGGIGALFGHIGGQGAGGGGFGALIGFAAVSGVLYWAREYLLYLVEAGHVAVLVALLDGKPLPAGKGQLAWGSEVVRAHFATSSMLFGLNQLIRGVLRAFDRMTQGIAAWLPIPGLDSLAKLVDAIVRTGLGRLDQVILAQILRRGDDEPWAVARDSVVLYAQNAKGALKNAVFLTLVIWGLTLLVLVAAAAPVAAMLAVFHVHAGIATFALAVIAALCLKAALIDPFATLALLQAYDRITRGQAPNAQWSAKLETMSAKFRELAQRARDAVRAPAAATGSAPIAVPPRSG